MEAVTYIRSILIRINQLKYMKCKLPREVEHATILMSYKIEVKDMNLVYFNTAFLFYVNSMPTYCGSRSLYKGIKLLYNQTVMQNRFVGIKFQHV